MFYLNPSLLNPRENRHN